MKLYKICNKFGVGYAGRLAKTSPAITQLLVVLDWWVGFRWRKCGGFVSWPVTKHSVTLRMLINYRVVKGGGSKGRGFPNIP